MDPEPNEHSTGGVVVPRQPPGAQMGPDVQAVSAGGDSGTGPLAELGWRPLAWSLLGKRSQTSMPPRHSGDRFILARIEVGPTLGVIYGACRMFLFLTVL